MKSFREKYNRGNPVLSDRLKTLRKEHGLTQEQLSEEVKKVGGECSKNYISMIERCTRPITRNIAHYLALVLEVDSEYLLDESETYKTSKERFQNELQSVLDESSKENALMLNAIYSLAVLNGYEVELQEIHGNRVLEIEKVCQQLKEYMIFKRNGEKQFSLSINDTNRFGNYLSDVFMSHIKWNIQK